MTKGYNSDSAQYDCMQLDVLLVEYVDGTIDPVVREVFEELMDQEPEVADRVHRLEGVRRRLCGLGCRCAAPDGFESRLKRHIAEDAVSSDGESSTGFRYTTLLTFVVLTLLAGSATWTVMMAEPEIAAEQAVTPVLDSQEAERQSARANRNPIPRRAVSAQPWSSRSAEMVLAGYGSQPVEVVAESLETDGVGAVPLSIP